MYLLTLMYSVSSSWASLFSCYVILVIVSQCPTTCAAFWGAVCLSVFLGRSVWWRFSLPMYSIPVLCYSWAGLGAVKTFYRWACRLLSILSMTVTVSIKRWVTNAFISSLLYFVNFLLINCVVVLVVVAWVDTWGYSLVPCGLIVGNIALMFFLVYLDVNYAYDGSP